MKILILAVLMIPFWVQAQRCGTDQLPINKTRSESMAHFSNWIQKKNQLDKSKKSLSPSTIYNVPVVFHIIHNGEDEGIGVNVPAERIAEQIQVLNKDFRRLNSDTTDTPEVFKGVAADLQLNFVLAKQDPEGLATSGITRTKGPEESYNLSDLELLTSIVHWPPEDYFNLYVTDLSGGTIGFAVFPFSNLDGTTSLTDNIRNQDACVIDYQYLGLNDGSDTEFQSFGRTATHEIGHYFGLLHTFEGGCSVNNDYCDDTPAISKSSLNFCASRPNTACNEEEITMKENFMDYTEDMCMNLFTEDQKKRVLAVMNYSPRRASLNTSHALEAPTVVANDLGIKSIVSPLVSDCSNELSPAVLLKNYGNNSISNASIAFSVDDVVIETYNINATLAAGATQQIEFDSYALNSDQLAKVQFEVTSVNGSADGKDFNNTKTTWIYAQNPQIAPYEEDFESSNSLSAVTETGDTSRWQLQVAPLVTAENKAAKLDCFDTTTNLGIKEMILTAPLDLSNLTSANLTFKYSYSGRLDDQYQDRLIVAVSTDCGSTFSTDNYIFSKSGNNLKTTTATDSDFTPFSSADWTEVSLNITPYISDTPIQIAFIGINGGGNNIYLDDISVSSADLAAFDAGIKTSISTPLITCASSLYPYLTVRNYGYEMITSITFEVEVDGQTSTEQFNDLRLLSGFEKNFRFTFSDLGEGFHEIKFNITSINDGETDQQINNNSFVYYFEINDDNEVIPAKTTFDNGSSKWSIMEINNEPIFEQLRQTRFDSMLRATAFDTGSLGATSYLISPILYTNSNESAAIRFKYAYGRRNNYTDNLSVLLSLNCGNDFEYELFSKNSEELTSIYSEDAYYPDDEDWQTVFISLDDYVDYASMRFAIGFTNGRGNHLYLDDIEILTSSDTTQLTFESRLNVYPNPADQQFYISFNLPKKQTVNVKMVDLTGKLILNENLDNILNQRLQFNADTERGYYLLVVKSEDLNMVKRIFIR